MIEDTTQTASSGFTEGQYLYCAIQTDDCPEFDLKGIDETPVETVRESDIVIVHQPVDDVYDSDDPQKVRQWVLTHQQVIDEVGQETGTPLPFRFDTIIRGGRDAIAKWMAEHETALREALRWLDGRWEYRIGLRWDETQVTEEIQEEDPELQDLSRRLETANQGTAFLLQKQFQQRLEQYLREHREHLAEELYTQLETKAIEIERTGGRSSSSFLGEQANVDTDPVVQLSVLATPAQSEGIGKELEPYAEDPTFDVRYTGPWPPYTFAPPIDAEAGEDA